MMQNFCANLNSMYSTRPVLGAVYSTVCKGKSLLTYDCIKVITVSRACDLHVMFIVSIRKIQPQKARL